MWPASTFLTNTCVSNQASGHGNCPDASLLGAQHWQCQPLVLGVGTRDCFGWKELTSFPGASLGQSLDLGKEHSRRFLFLPRAKTFPVPHSAPTVRGWGSTSKGETHSWDR